MRRRKVIIGKSILAFVCVGGVWGLLFWLTGLYAITIRNIEIQGNIVVSSAEITGVAEQFLAGRYWFTVSRGSILFYPKAAIMKSLSDLYPRIEHVDVGFKNLNTIAISVFERQTVALWCRVLQVESSSTAKPEVSTKKFDECFSLDKAGFVFAPFTDAARATSTPFIKFYGPLSDGNPVGQTYLSANRFHALVAFAGHLAPLGFTVQAFRERPDKDMDVEFAGGGHLIVATDANLDSVTANLQSIVSDPSFGGVEGISRINYVDLRFGNKVFYKLK